MIWHMIHASIKVYVDLKYHLMYHSAVNTFVSLYTSIIIVTLQKAYWNRVPAHIVYWYRNIIFHVQYHK